MLYEDFKPIVDLMLNNWTALQLAVEHGMGVPGGKKTAQLMSVYIARFCVENIVDVDELQEVIEDLMDEEFDTCCRDNSPREISQMLLHFLSLLKDGKHDEVRSTLETMPACQTWLSQPDLKAVPKQHHGNPDDDTTSSGSDTEGSDIAEANGNCEGASARPIRQEQEPMDEDVEPGWTVVRTKKK